MTIRSVNSHNEIDRTPMTPPCSPLPQCHTEQSSLTTMDRGISSICIAPFKAIWRVVCTIFSWIASWFTQIWSQAKEEFDLIHKDLCRTDPPTYKNYKTHVDKLSPPVLQEYKKHLLKVYAENTSQPAGWVEKNQNFDLSHYLEINGPDKIVTKAADKFWEEIKSHTR